jgi:hypothetical protein
MTQPQEPLVTHACKIPPVHHRSGTSQCTYDEPQRASLQFRPGLPTRGGRNAAGAACRRPITQA